MFGCRNYWLGDDKAWNLFETILVALAVGEMIITEGSPALGVMPARYTNFNTSTLRMARFCRLAKVLRVFKLTIFRDLTMMINGLMGGLSTLCWAMVLIFIPLYVVALLLRESVETLPDKSGAIMFKTVLEAFFTVFRCMVSGDCSDEGGRPIFVLMTREYSWHYAVIYCTTVVLMTFGLFNVIIAIYVENITVAAKRDELVQMHARLQDDKIVIGKAQEIMSLVWKVKKRLERESHRSMQKHLSVKELARVEITQEVIDILCSNERFQVILRELDVSNENQLDLFDTLDVDGGGTLDLEEMVTGIIKLRGDARRADVIAVGLKLTSLQTAFQKFESKFDSFATRVSNAEVVYQLSTSRLES